MKNTSDLRLAPLVLV